MASPSNPGYTIRHATQSDVPTILALIRELAEYEKELDSCKMTEERLLATLSFPIFSTSTTSNHSGPKAGPEPDRVPDPGRDPEAFTPGYARTLLLITPSSSSSSPQPSSAPNASPPAATVAGMALYFPNYSTWTGPGIYLEDLIVTSSQRGKGYGKALLSALAREVARINPYGMGRLQWSVLNWNKPSIDFYLSDGVGAFLKHEWLGCQVEGEKLVKLAEAMMP